MSCGKPVVFTRETAGPDLVTHEENGLLCDPSSPDDIAAKLLRVINNPMLAKELSVAARHSIVKRFNARDVAQLYVQYFQSLLNK